MGEPGSEFLRSYLYFWASLAHVPNQVITFLDSSQCHSPQHFDPLGF